MLRFLNNPLIFLSLLTVFSLLIGGWMVGCQDARLPPTEPNTEDSNSRPDPLKLLVIGEEHLGAVVARQWAARRDGELTVVTQSIEDFIQSDFRLADAVDVVIFPPRLLGEFTSRDQLLTIPNRIWGSEELNKDEILRLHRGTLVRHGEQNWAVPLGAPQLTMMFRSDDFDRDQVKALNNWDSLAGVIEKIGADQFDLPLAKGWAAHVLLARSASLIRDRGKLSTVFERRTMQPLIDSAAFVLAFNDLKELVAKSDHHFDLEPIDIFRRIMSGKSQLGITWPARSAFEDETPPETTPAIGFVNLPGSSQWYDPQEKTWIARRKNEKGWVPYLGYGGLIGAVPRSSRNTSAAFGFLEWLASKPINLATVVESPESGPFRASHLGDPSAWTGTVISDAAARQFADVISEVNDEDVVLIFPRVRGRERYLAVLDDAVRDGLMNDQDGAEVLAKVAEKWEVLTEEIGRNLQLAELRKDSGL